MDNGYLMHIKIKQPVLFCRSLEADRESRNAALAKTYDFLTEGSYGLEMATAPKAMADMVESLAGAIYVDSGCQLDIVWKA